MTEKFRYRARALPNWSYQGSPWVYFEAYSDEDAKDELYQRTGLSARKNNDEVEIQMWDEDFKIWMTVE